MLQKPAIVFMGTAPFAVPSLEKLLDSGYNVTAVVTAPDKPAGRGRKVTVPAVKAFAQQKGLQIYQPVNLKDPAFLNTLRELNPGLQVVVAFRMLPKEIWSMPPLGTINLHASLLPDYRGAAPINHAIMNGEKMTGVTTFIINEQIDTGPILFQEEVVIRNNENAGSLHDRLMITGANLVVKTVNAIALGSVIPNLQQDIIKMPISAAPKIFKENCRIDWAKSVEKVYNFIRGLSPVPGAFTKLKMLSGNETILKIYESEPLKSKTSIKPGQCLTDGENYLKIACCDGYISVLHLQQEGKKRMPIRDFLRGFNHHQILQAIK